MKKGGFTTVFPYLRLLGCVLAGALCMVAFTLSPVGYVGISDPPLAAGSAVWLLYAALLAGLFWLATGKRVRRLTPAMVAFALLFGVINYFATTLFAYDTWAFLQGVGAWAQAVLCILLQSAVMAAVFAVVSGWLEGVHAQGAAGIPAQGISSQGIHTQAVTAQDKPSPQGNPAQRAPRLAARIMSTLQNIPNWLMRRFPRIAAWARRRPTLAFILVMLLGWSPFLIAFYPGTIIWDMGEMIGQVYGLRELSTWHPVFTTGVFGACVWLGRLVGSDNVGAFLFTALQTAALAYALADSIRLMGRMGVSRMWRFATLLFFAFTPIFAAFAQAVGKDTLYTAVLLLFATRLTEALRFGGLSGKRRAGLFVWALLTCLVRNNGLYVVLGTAVGITAFGLRGKQKLVTGGVLGAALVAAMLFTGVLVPALGIKDTTASGLYSLAFQQSARVLRDHEASVTPQEYAEIDLVLDAANLPSLYEANISDPVKYTFRQYGQGYAAETAALARYRQTWLSMLGKYPLVYLEAFVAGSTGYYAFTPKIDAARTYNYQGGIRFVFETYDLGEDARYLHTTQAPALERARQLLAAYARGWRRVPVLELFLLSPSYTWLLVAAALTLLRKRGWREEMAFLPALLSMGVCLLSPVNDYFRYFLPIVAMAPMLMGLAGTGANKKRGA